MPYVLDERSQNTSSSSISGWRTSPLDGSPGSSPQSAKSPIDPCSQVLRLVDPFIFEMRSVNKPITYIYYKKGKKHVGTKLVSYKRPFYQKQSRTLGAWREIAEVARKLVREGVINKRDTPQMYKMCMWLFKALFRYRKRKCGAVIIRSAHAQNPCDHTKYEYEKEQDFVYNAPIFGDPVPYTWSSIDSAYCGKNIADTGGANLSCPPNPYWDKPSDYWQYSSWVNQWRTDTFDRPFDNMLNNLEYITAILWPSPQDLTEDESASPLIDVAEAIADGSILGEPPSPRDAREILEDMSGVSPKYLRALRRTIDFGANSWLWAKLVAQPVYSSAVALSASVEANDNRIKRINELSTTGQWIKGRKLRIYNNNYSCFEPPESQFHKEWDNGQVQQTLDEYVTVDNYQGNAFFVYRLGLDNQILTSGQQIGMYFQSLSTSLQQVAYNLVPMSFVFDWFSSTYSGKLDLSSKTFLNVRDSKTIISMKTELSYKRIASASSSCVYARIRGDHLGCDGKVYTPSYRFGDLPDLSWGCYVWEILNSYSMSKEFDNSGKWTRYRRYAAWNVPPNPNGSMLCQDASTGSISSGQQVTLAALVWSAIGATYRGSFSKKPIRLYGAPSL